MRVRPRASVLRGDGRADLPAYQGDLSRRDHYWQNEEFVRIADPFASKAAPSVQQVTAPTGAVPESRVRRMDAGVPADRGRVLPGMLTAASAAIPIYFAVLQYLGVDHAAIHLLVRLAVVPAVLFLLSATVFAVAHRPRLRSVPVGDFGQIRARTLRRLDRLIALGSALFLTATAGSLAVFAALL
jgi:hypothetical protein